MCPSKHCSDVTGISENLDRVPAHPIDVEGDANNGIHRHFWPQKLLKSPKSSYLFVVQKVVLCRSDLFLGFMCQVVFWKPVGARWGLRTLGHQLAGLEQLPTGRPCACSEALLFLLGPFVQRQKAPPGWDPCSGDLADRPEHSVKAPACPKKVEGRVNNGIYPLQGEASCGFSVFSVWYLPLVCCSEVVHLALSCLTGATALYLCAHLSLFMEGGKFIVLYCLLYTAILHLSTVFFISNFLDSYSNLFVFFLATYSILMLLVSFYCFNNFKQTYFLCSIRSFLCLKFLSFNPAICYISCLCWIVSCCVF